MSDITVKNFTCGYGEKTVFQDFDIAFKENTLTISTPINLLRSSFA